MVILVVDSSIAVFSGSAEGRCGCLEGDNGRVVAGGTAAGAGGRRWERATEYTELHEKRDQKLRVVLFVTSGGGCGCGCWLVGCTASLVCYGCNSGWFCCGGSLLCCGVEMLLLFLMPAVWEAVLSAGAGRGQARLKICMLEDSWPLSCERSNSLTLEESSAKCLSNRMVLNSSTSCVSKLQWAPGGEAAGETSSQSPKNNFFGRLYASTAASLCGVFGGIPGPCLPMELGRSL